MTLRTVKDVLSKLPPPVIIPKVRPGDYSNTNNKKGIGLAVESMKRHMTDEGWQIFESLETNGYQLFGYNLGDSLVNVPKILDLSNPGVVFVQDKREWDPAPGDFREQAARFQSVEVLARYPTVFKVTILKDAHHRPEYHRQSANEMGVHAWVIYYHPEIVQRLAPYLRPEHLIRTYHSLDKDLVPPYNFGIERSQCLFSGAVSAAYPMRQRIVAGLNKLPGVTYLKHPGYHREGTFTPQFLRVLNNYKVSICTSSMYGFALRKIMESVACGCKVITDLPVDEVLPAIDECLIRVPSDIPILDLNDLVVREADTFDDDRQLHYAKRAKAYYDYRASGARLVADIEAMRLSYTKGE